MTRERLQSVIKPDAAASFANWRAVLDRSIPALDGVRGVAILSVLAHQLILDRENNSHCVKLLLVPVQAGWIGVELFFVLSGFLITGILLDSSDAVNRWSSFFIRRCLRILPPYYFLLAVMFWLAPAVLRLPSDLTAQLRHQSWYWLHLANWTTIGGNGIDPLAPCWSLSVEEQFYLAWPPLVFMLQERRLFRVCLLIAGLALAVRTGLVLTNANPETVYECTFSRVDALTAGALAALVVRHRDLLMSFQQHLSRVFSLAVAAVIAVALVSGGLMRTNRVTLTLGHSVLTLAFTCLVFVAVRDTVRGTGWIGALLAWAPLRLFGRHSYAIYLFHLPLHLLAYRLILADTVRPMSSGRYLCVQAAYFALGGAILLGISLVFHRVIEQPILDLKKYFVVRRTPDPQPRMHGDALPAHGTGNSRT